MRLKEDSSSYKAENVKRRDTRQDKTIDKIIANRKTKKNTSKFCKGRVGVEHKWVVQTPRNRTILSRMRLNVCSNCGKQDWTSTEWYCYDCGEWNKDLFHKCDGQTL